MFCVFMCCARVLFDVSFEVTSRCVLLVLFGMFVVLCCVKGYCVVICCCFCVCLSVMFGVVCVFVVC